MSTATGRATGYIAVHRYFREDPTEYFAAVEDIMKAHGGRPHWGKMNTGPRPISRRPTRGSATSSRCAIGSTPIASSLTRTWSASSASSLPIPADR